MKKNMFSVGMLGIFLTFIFIFSGCASIPKNLGKLTITGIPAEYEGGTVVSALAGGGTGTISNGSVSITARTIPDKTTGAGDLAFNVTKAGTDNPSAGIFFKSVTFANETASVNWSDGVMTGLVTITGIPANYNRNAEEHIGQVAILAGKDLRKGGALALLGGYTGSEAVGQGFAEDGAVSIPLWTTGLPMPFIQSTEMRVLLSIGAGSGGTVGNATVLKTDNFIFESVQFTNGNANISFSQGTKQL